MHIRQCVAHKGSVLRTVFMSGGWVPSTHDGESLRVSSCRRFVVS